MLQVPNGKYGFSRGPLKASQSVDLFKAQLEEKDKTIEALKQAAKVRKLKNNMLKKTREKHELPCSP